MSTAIAVGASGFSGASYRSSDIPGFDSFMAYPSDTDPRALLQRVSEGKPKRVVNVPGKKPRQLPDLTDIVLCVAESVRDEKSLKMYGQFRLAGAEVRTGEHCEINLAEVTVEQIAGWIETGSIPPAPEPDEDDDLYGEEEGGLFDDWDEAPLIEDDAPKQKKPKTLPDDEPVVDDLDDAPTQPVSTPYRAKKIPTNRQVTDADTNVVEKEAETTPKSSLSVARIGSNDDYSFDEMPIPESTPPERNRDEDEEPVIDRRASGRSATRLDLDDEEPVADRRPQRRAVEEEGENEPGFDLDDEEFAAPVARPKARRIEPTPVTVPEERVQKRPEPEPFEDDDTSFSMPEKFARKDDDKPRRRPKFDPSKSAKRAGAAVDDPDDDFPLPTAGAKKPARSRDAEGDSLGFGSSFPGVDDEREDTEEVSDRRKRPRFADTFDEPRSDSRANSSDDDDDDFDLPDLPTREETDSERNIRRSMERDGFSRGKIDEQIEARRLREREGGALERSEWIAQNRSSRSSKKFYITGAAGGVGKTTLTWTCANMLAEHLKNIGDDRPVYLIETDFANPKLEQRLQHPVSGTNLGSVAREIAAFSGQHEVNLTAEDLAKIVDKYTMKQNDSNLNVLVCPYRVDAEREFLAYAIMAAMQVATQRGAYIFLDSSNATTKQMDHESFRIASKTNIVVIVTTPNNMPDAERAAYVMIHGTKDKGGAAVSGIPREKIRLFLNHGTVEQQHDIEVEKEMQFAGMFPFVEEISQASQSSGGSPNWVGSPDVPADVTEYMYSHLPEFLYGLGIPEMASYASQADYYTTKPSLFSRLFRRR